MKGHSIEQRVQIIKFYYQNQCSVRETFCALRDFYPRHNRPAESTIRHLAKFESTGSINNQPTSVCCKVCWKHRWECMGKPEAVNFSSFKNLAFLRFQLDEFCVGTWVCTHKIQLTQELKVNDHRQRRVSADWVLEQLEVNSNFAKQIIFSDEAHFWMNGYVNQQNCRIWDDTNPRETPAPNASRKSHSLVRILVWRNHRSVLLPKWCGRCHNHQRRALQIDDKQLLVA